MFNRRLSYRCPLCLKVLTAQDNLVRFCTKHPQSVATVAGDSLKDDSRCQIERACNETIQPQGVFLRHVGCTAQNPFPNRDALTNAASIGNWQIKILTQIFEQTSAKDASSSLYGTEMWFALMLLRATTERNETGKRCGALVGLGGARNAGKTILAMQAMDVQGYVNPQAKATASHQIADESIQDYIYSHQVEDVTTANNPMFETLRIRENMRRNRGSLSLPRGTQKTVGDLKTVFFKPAAHEPSPVSPSTKKAALVNPAKTLPAPAEDVDVRAAHRLPIDKSPSGDWKTVAANAWAKAVSLYRWARKHLKTDFPTPGTINPDYFYTVALYDTAGELSESDHVLLDRLDQAIDKAAVVIDAQDIFNINRSATVESSVAVAVARLKLTTQVPQLKTCLIVTKLDRFVQHLTDGASFNPEEFARELETGNKEERKLLAEWLEKYPNARNNELLTFARDKQKIDAIFFVWTENLPPSHDLTAQQDQPVSYNLDRFIAWCLEIEWSKIGASA